MSDTIISLDSSLLIGNTDDISINEAESMTPTDAMLVSLDKRGFIDLELIAQISKMSIEEAVRDLIENGAVFRDPHNWDGNDTEGIVQADEYLSGFVLAKFKQAQEAEKNFPGKFKNNIAQLKKIIPKGTIGRDQIHIAIHNPLGYPFIDAFIEALLGVPVGVNYKRGDPKFTSRVEASGAYRIPSKQRYGKYNTAANKTYGTSDMNALHLIEKMINGTEIVVKEKNYGSRGRPKIDHKATQLLLEKSELIAEKWEEWLWSDSVRSKLILTAYEERIGSFVPRVYNFKPSFPGMNNNMALRPYQIENVVQILYSPNTLLALPVGRGKTYIMAAAAMKFKQMNNDKVLIVVPNHIIKQWEFMFKELYPDANILVVEPKHFGPSKRQKVLAKIRDNDFDAIIISKSSFDLITVSSEYKYKKLEAEIKSLKIQRQNITDANNATAKSEKNYLDKIIKKKSDDLVKLGVKSLDEINKIMFDELNINRLFIDEAHTYKNIPVSIQYAVKGITTIGSNKCKNLLEKVKYLQENNRGGGVVFATGTPVTNNLSDLFAMQTYLQPGSLRMQGVEKFSDWVDMFGRITTDYEIDVDTAQFKRTTRLSGVVNLAQLSSVLREIMCSYDDEENAKSALPKFNGYEDIVVQKNKEIQDFLEEVSIRADIIRLGLEDPKKDNLLKLTIEGRLAALDTRLLNDSRFTNGGGKIIACAKIIADIYHTKSDATQLVFCDVGTPKDGFNVYDELKKLLIEKGVEEKDIAFIHDAKTSKARARMLTAVNDGEIRILIGSTDKLGTGTNIQRHLYALHHLSVPWRPADMTQRDGRILREGNLNKSVRIFRYVTEGSFDAFSYQLLEVKMKMINSIVKGNIEAYEADNVDESALSYAEIKALAIGSPLIKKRVIASNELSRLRILRNKELEERNRLKQTIDEIDERREILLKELTRSLQDAKLATTNPKPEDKKTRTQIRELIWTTVECGPPAFSNRTILVYRGFRIFIDRLSFNKDKPSVCISTERSRFEVKIPMKSSCLLRIDNAIDSIESSCEKMQESIKRLSAEKSNILEELNKHSLAEDYYEKINELKNTIQELDFQIEEATIMA